MKQGKQNIKKLIYY